MSSAIAKLILRMMPLASVLGFGISLCLIKEQLYYTAAIVEYNLTEYPIGSSHRISSTEGFSRYAGRVRRCRATTGMYKQCLPGGVWTDVAEELSFAYRHGTVRKAGDDSSARNTSAVCDRPRGRI